MKDKTGWLSGLMLCIAFLLVASIGCSGPAVVNEQRNIASACATITAAGNAVATAVEAGKLSKADARAALAIIKPTVAFCEPKPAEHLSAADYAVLVGAAADLATWKDLQR